MEVIANAMAFLRGYNVRLALIVQGLSQLEEHYGRAGMASILQNAAIQVFAAANDPSTARYVSERLGKRTVRTESHSEGAGFGKRSRTRSYTGRDLLLPQEVHELDADALIVFKEGARPVLGRKIRYFEETDFLERYTDRSGTRTRLGLRAQRSPVPPTSVPVLELVQEPAPSADSDSDPSENSRRARAAALAPQLRSAALESSASALEG